MHVTLNVAKNYLRVDSSDDDALIEQLITTATGMVNDISRMSDEELAPYKDIVATAELYIIAYLYEHREEADHRKLTETVKYLLFSVRKEAF